MAIDYKALFDQGVDRRGTNCVKWDALGSLYQNPDAIPMWVADTDFAAPPEVVEAVVRRAQHGAFGYSAHDGADVRAAAAWLAGRHKVEGVSEDWFVFCPGVVDALYVSVLALTKPGDRIAIQTPLYGPFRMVVEKAGREVYENRLIHGADGSWKMDLENLEQGLAGGVKLMLLCSPHNPTGRVWTRAELTDLVALCNRYNVPVACDEIHADIIMPGYEHTSILSIPGAEKAVMAMAPSKTFNLAGLCHSFFAVPDKDTREVMRAKLSELGLTGSNVFGELACAAAYTYGAPGLDALNEYLQANRTCVEEFFAANMPEVGVTKGEGTFLMWLDFTAWGLPEDDLGALLARNGAALNKGTFFGADWGGWMRLNIGTPRRILEQGLANILKAAREVRG